MQPIHYLSQIKPATGPAAQSSAHSDPRSAPGTHRKLGHNAATDSMLAFPSII
jgi:hypothetical protein